MLVKIAIVFNYILLVLMIHYFRAVIPQTDVDIFFLSLPLKYLHAPTWEIERVINFYSFT